MQRISDAIFYDNILFHVFQKHFEKFLFISDHTESDHALKQLLKGAAKKVKSGMKIQTFKMFSFETNWFTEMLKQTRKMRHNVIYNVEPLLKYERHPSWERFVDSKKVEQKFLFISFFIIPLIEGAIIIDDQHLFVFKVS